MQTNNKPNIDFGKVWNDLKPQLDKEAARREKKKRRFIFFWFFGVAIALGVGIATKKQLTSNEKQVTNRENINAKTKNVDAATNNAVGVTNNTHEVTNNGLEVTNNGLVKAKNKAVSAEDKVILDKNKVISAEDKAISAKNKAVSAEDKAILDKNKAVSAEDKVILDKNKVISAEDKAISTKNKAVSGKNKAILGEDKQITGKNLDDSTSENIFSTSNTVVSTINSKTINNEKQEPTNKNNQKPETRNENNEKPETRNNLTRNEKRETKYSYGLQFNLPIVPSYNLLDANANKNISTIIIPTAWVSKSINKKENLLFFINPYSAYYSSSKAVISNTNYNITTQQGTQPQAQQTTYTELIAFNKLIGVETGLLWQHQLTNKIKIAAGISSYFAQSALLQNKVIKNEKTVTRDSIYSAGKNDTEWKYMQQNFILGKVEIQYQFKKVSAGIGFSKPIGNVFNNIAQDKTPINANLFLRWKIK